MEGAVQDPGRIDRDRVAATDAAYYEGLYDPALKLETLVNDNEADQPPGPYVDDGDPLHWTFVVTNSGVVEHEFYLGDEAAQAEHEKEMAAMGGMTHDEPEGIAVKPGETTELTYTFASAGETLAGCHVVGHYGGGMRAAITVTG